MISLQGDAQFYHENALYLTFCYVMFLLEDPRKGVRLKNRRVSFVTDFYCVCPRVQVSDQLSVKALLPVFNLLGSLVETVPNVALSLVTQYGELMQHTHNHIITVVQALVCEAKQWCIFMRN